MLKSARIRGLLDLEHEPDRNLTLSPISFEMKSCEQLLVATVASFYMR